MEPILVEAKRIFTHSSELLQVFDAHRVEYAKYRCADAAISIQSYIFKIVATCVILVIVEQLLCKFLMVFYQRYYIEQRINM